MLEYKFDTQLLIEGENLSEDKISDYITTNIKGDCLLAVGDEEMIKIHFHTNAPWKLLEYCGIKGDSIMSKLRMAACGIDCNECGSYKVTMEQDLNAAESLVEWYRGCGWIGENEGAEAVIKKAPLCKGCWNASDGCFFKCVCHRSRDFRICCTEKQIDHCGECDDFPCDHYLEWANWDGAEHHKKVMEYLLSLRKNT